MRVAICVPSGDMVHTGFAVSLAGLVRSYPGEHLSLINKRQALLCDSRNGLVVDALERGADWLFWLDSDVMVPANAIERLLAHKAPIVGCQYARRVPPHTATGTPVAGAQANPTTGLLEMESLGFGCILISAQMFKSLRKPWFHVTNRPGLRPIGEDTNFCRAAIAAGFALYADMRLSLEVGHIGEAVYTLSAEAAI